MSGRIALGTYYDRPRTRTVSNWGFRHVSVEFDLNSKSYRFLLFTIDKILLVTVEQSLK